MRTTSSRPQLNSSEIRWETLRNRLDALAGLLAERGCLSSRRTGQSSRVWSVRYSEVVDSRRVQRTLYVGKDPVVVQRTRQYLAGLRRDAEWIDGLPALCRASRGLMRVLRRARKSSK